MKHLEYTFTSDRYDYITIQITDRFYFDWKSKTMYQTDYYPCENNKRRSETALIIVPIAAITI